MIFPSPPNPPRWLPANLISALPVLLYARGEGFSHSVLYVSVTFTYMEALLLQPAGSRAISILDSALVFSSPAAFLSVRQIGFIEFSQRCSTQPLLWMLRCRAPLTPSHLLRDGVLHLCWKSRSTEILLLFFICLWISEWGNGKNKVVEDSVLAKRANCWIFGGVRGWLKLLLYCGTDDYFFSGGPYQLSNLINKPNWKLSVLHLSSPQRASSSWHIALLMTPFQIYSTGTFLETQNCSGSRDC